MVIVDHLDIVHPASRRRSSAVAVFVAVQHHCRTGYDFRTLALSGLGVSRTTLHRLVGLFGAVASSLSSASPSLCSVVLGVQHRLGICHSGSPET